MITLFEKPSRYIHTVFLHCSASDEPAYDDISVIKRWHLQRGFADVGYHYFIQKNGNLQKGRPLDQRPAAQKGYNTGSIAICCHGLQKSKFTEQQFRTLKILCLDIILTFENTDMRFRGHTEVSPKLCPVYDYKQILNLDIEGRIQPGILK